MKCHQARTAEKSERILKIGKQLSMQKSEQKVSGKHFYSDDELTSQTSWNAFF